MFSNLARPDLARRLHDTLAELAGSRQSYGLLDYPAHPNIGDSAIWLGEIEILTRLHGHPPDYVTHIRYPDTEPGRMLGEGDLIYLHGGGNFGDVWGGFQAYRERIISRHPHSRIIQLPQSIHFSDPAAADSTRRAIAAHPDYHLMVRDQPSLEFAKTHFDCPVILAPDSAFGIETSQFHIPHAASAGGVALLRDDHERRPDAASGRVLFDSPGWRLKDWDTYSPLRRRLQKLEMGGLGVLSLKGAMRLRERRFTAAAQGRVAMGLRQLDLGDVVVTDRLHGHILSTLIDKPHVVIDNFYGKIRNFIDSWGKTDTTRLAKDYTEAKRLAEELTDRP